MPTTVLVTGGAGFIGHHLARRLAFGGDRVLVTDVAFAHPPELGDPERAILDVTDRSAVWSLLATRRPGLLVHLAGILSGGAEVDSARAFDVNVGGTFNVLEGSRRADVGRVVVASSAAVYDAPQPRPACDEEDALAPFGVYGMTKAALEDWCAFYHRRHGLDVRVVRPAALVGPGREASGAASNWTTALIQEPLAGRPYACPVAESDALPVVYHTDLLGGLLALCRADRVGARVYNLGACSTTAAELAQLVRARVPQAQITFQPTDLARLVVGRLRYCVLDDHLATRDLGYRPAYDTIAKMVDAFIAEVRARR